MRVRLASAQARHTTFAQRDVVHRVRYVGYIVLAVQFVAFLCWSTLLYQRYALAADFAQYHQAWYLIAHGNLDPRDTLGRFPFWQNHSEFMLWPAALLYWVWPHCVDLAWLQDIGVCVAEAVAFTWLCEIAGKRRTGGDAAWLAGAGLLLLVIDPWIWWHLVRLPLRDDRHSVRRSAGLGYGQRPAPGVVVGPTPAGLW